MTEAFLVWLWKVFFVVFVVTAVCFALVHTSVLFTVCAIQHKKLWWWWLRTFKVCHLLFCGFFSSLSNRLWCYMKTMCKNNSGGRKERPGKGKCQLMGDIKWKQLQVWMRWLKVIAANVWRKTTSLKMTFFLECYEVKVNFGVIKMGIRFILGDWKDFVWGNERTSRFKIDKKRFPNEIFYKRFFLLLEFLSFPKFPADEALALKNYWIAECRVFVQCGVWCKLIHWSST